jgi:hypothetical protein
MALAADTDRADRSERGAADDFAGVESEYARLYREVCRAAADAQVSAQKRLLKSTDRVESDNLKWFLERWGRDTWGAQVVIKVQNEIRQQMAIEVLSLVRETLDDEPTYRAVESRLLEEGDRDAARSTK